MSLSPLANQSGAAGPDGTRFGSWKEIAAYLQRDVTTVRRWEKREGLPIHRQVHARRDSVYAYQAEIDAWWDARSRRLDRPNPGRVGKYLFAAGALAAMVGYGLYRAVDSPGRGSIGSVAILSFENATGDPNNAYLGDGITDSLTSALSRLSDLKVASRASVVRYRATGMDLQEIGRALGVEAVLLGRVSQRGERLSISVELVNCADGRQLWGEQYLPRAADIFVVQADIAREALRALRRSLTAQEETALRGRYPRSIDAYRHYLQGRQHLDKRDREGFAQAIADFQQAVERDPDYAVAYVGLADAHSLMGYYRLRPPKESYQPPGSRS